MLCYQYSRNATDIIHDTFRWLRDNGRVMRVVTLILLPLSLVFQWFCAAFDTSRPDFFDSIVKYYFPSFNNSETGSGTVQTFHHLILLVVVLCIVPLLRHYFLSRKSVKHISLPRLGGLTLQHLWPALGSALLALVTYFLASLLLKTVIFGYGILFLMAFPVSASIMHGWSFKFEGMADNWLLAVRYLFLISFVVFVLQVFPLYTFGLIALALQMLEESVGIVMPYIEDLEEEFTFVMGALSYLMFGYSMVVLFVSLTLFHGAVTEESEW